MKEASEEYMYMIARQIDEPSYRIPKVAEQANDSEINNAAETSLVARFMPKHLEIDNEVVKIMDFFKEEGRLTEMKKKTRYKVA